MIIFTYSVCQGAQMLSGELPLQHHEHENAEPKILRSKRAPSNIIHFGCCGRSVCVWTPESVTLNKKCQLVGNYTCKVCKRWFARNKGLSKAELYHLILVRLFGIEKVVKYIEFVLTILKEERDFKLRDDIERINATYLRSCERYSYR